MKNNKFKFVKFFNKFKLSNCYISEPINGFFEIEPYDITVYNEIVKELRQLEIKYNISGIDKLNTEGFKYPSRLFACFN